MRYYFNIVGIPNGTDTDGSDLPSLSYAKREALKLAGAMLAEGAMETNEGFQVHVVDETGLVMFRLDITTAEPQPVPQAA